MDNLKHQRPPTQFDDTEDLTSSMIEEIQNGIIIELERAVIEHPKFPIDPVQMLAIVAEEVGEAMQAAIDFDWHRHSDIGLIQIELDQTAAMCIRTIAALQTLSDQGVYSERT